MGFKRNTDQGGLGQSESTAMSSCGFTLVELLSAMTLLVIIVLMLTRVYSESVNAIQIGKRSTERNVNARAVMDFMARELSQAVFDYGDNPGENFLGMAYYANTTPGVFGLEGADQISFITLTKDVTDGGNDGEKRSAQQIRYFVENQVGLADAPEHARYRFALWRDAYQPQDAGSGSRPPGAYHSVNDDSSLKWMGSDADNLTLHRRTGMLIDNVRTFEVFVYTDEEGASMADWQSFSGDPDAKIAFMDIYLETMDERDAAQAARLADVLGPNHETVVEFVERSVKRNYRRIHFHNKLGYQDVTL